MSSSEGGKRILASTKGVAETKREVSKAWGETRSWRQLRELRSEVEVVVELRYTTGLGFSGTVFSF